MILIIISIFIEDTYTKSSIFILILFASIQFQEINQPYLTGNLNLTELNGCLSIFLIFIVRIFNFTLEDNVYSKYICFAMGLLLEVQFLYLCFLNSVLIKIYAFVTKRQKKKKQTNMFMSKLSKSKILSLIITNK